LQHANVSRTFQSLGASIEDLPILWLAAPVAGLIVQPIIGYLSDRTWGRLGRRCAVRRGQTALRARLRVRCLRPAADCRCVTAAARCHPGMLHNVVNDLYLMPKVMRQLAVVQFLSWFALFAMWIYTTAAVTEHH
jgi:hypothetical protein